jgi:multisubunit Na+/H+ antiporter MnhB subunit
MRFLIASLMLVAVMCFGPLAMPALALAQGQPVQGKVDVNINTHSGGGAWWANPIWIAIGVIALVLLVVIVAMAARGSGTTVIKE